MLNRKGEYNRCGLTRMVLDDRWEKEKWERAWEVENNATGGEEVDNLNESRKNKNTIQDNLVTRKKRKIENDEGIVWGEPVGDEVVKREEFLKSGREVLSGQSQQQKLKVLTGAEWMAHNLVMEIVRVATQVVFDTCLMAEWDEWSEVVSPPHPTTNTTSTPADIVEHCQGVPTKKEVKNVKKSVKNVKKRGKSALVKVDPGQTTLDSFVVKKRKCVEENSVSKDCEQISEEEQNYSFMLQDEEYLERQMRLERVKREKLRWVGVVISQELCAITLFEKGKMGCKKCLYMLWENLGKWAKFKSNFVDLSPPPPQVVKTSSST